MSKGIFLALTVLAVGASSLEAQVTARRVDPYGNDGGYYADDDYWYGGQNRVTNTRFRGMDRNNDGMITRSEWRGNSRSFRNQDWNRDGVLSGREVRRNAQRVRNSRQRVDAVDQDRNGRIDRSEWFGSRNEFRRIDRNNDGWITADEARMRYY